MSVRSIAYGLLALACLATVAYVVTRSGINLAGPQQRFAPLSTSSFVAVPSNTINPSNAANPSTEQALTRSAIGADTVSAFGNSLLHSTDAAQRRELVKVLQAAAHTQDNAIHPREPQTLDILAAAYSLEKDVSVKVEIVNALSEFNAPEAAELLNRALEDDNVVVRKAAQHAKIRRERRLLFARCCE